MIENISSETMQTRENGVTSLKYFKKICQHRTLYSVKISFNDEAEIDTYKDN